MALDVLTVMDLDFEVGQINMGGTRGSVFYVPANHIKTEAVLDTDGVTYITAPVLKTGKRWGEVYITKDTGSIEDKEVGELDGGSYETEIEFFHPKVRAELLKLKNIFTNGGFVFVMKDGNGNMRQIGSKELPAYRMPGTVSGGKTPKDRNGASFKFTASCPTPAPIATYAISLTPAI